ncbi:metal ABC transporter permease [Pseudomonas aeruginosa]|uniref:metal ABC transporter permease n=1 Tax=Pseudomonas aeruginosa TaxID=287 RepID=UPI0034D29E13
MSPKAIAALLTCRFSSTLQVAMGIFLFSTFTGIYLSFFFDSSPTLTNVLVLECVFLGACFVGEI